MLELTRMRLNLIVSSLICTPLAAFYIPYMIMSLIIAIEKHESKLERLRKTHIFCCCTEKIFFIIQLVLVILYLLGVLGFMIYLLYLDYGILNLIPLIIIMILFSYQARLLRKYVDKYRWHFYVEINREYLETLRQST